MLQYQECKEQKGEEIAQTLVAVVPCNEVVRARAQALRLANYGIRSLVFSDPALAARWALIQEPP